MKKVIQAAGTAGLKVILDYHRRDVTSNDGDPESGIWYNQTYPMSFFLNTWKSVATYFKDEANVVGVSFCVLMLVKLPKLTPLLTIFQH